MHQSVWRWSALVVGVEVASALTIFHPVANSILTVGAALVMVWLSWKRPTMGLAVLALELLIGSKGYLLQFALLSTPISLRIALTLAFLFGWLVNFLQHGSIQALLSQFKDKRAYLVLLVLIGYATIRGLQLNSMGNVLGDGNAWGDWMLLFPVLDISWRYRETIRRDALPVFFVGLGWLAVKTIGLEYYFSHALPGSSNVYLWVRRTGVGEVTLMTANAFRIFMQSYVYAIAGLIVALGWWFTQTGQKKTAWWMMVASTVILGVSLSRSFWIGAMAGALMLVVVFSLKKIAWWKKLVGPISAAVAGVAIIFVTLALPLPPVNFASLASLFNSRTHIGEEAAAVSRWNLLPVLWHKIVEHPVLGSGFGATVTYQSKDPRIVAQTGGMYTTYAFEWGWLEHWIKFGIVGIPLIAYLLWSLGKRLWKLDEPMWLRASVVSCLIALGVTHFFTPYLNHPLGFLFFFVGEGMILSSGAVVQSAKKVNS